MMQEAIENQGLDALAQQLWNVRIEKARATNREAELTQRFREELVEDKSARFGDIRVDLKGGGPTKRFNREIIRPYVSEQLWASCFELKPGTVRVLISQNGIAPKKALSGEKGGKQ